MFARIRMTWRVLLGLLALAVVHLVSLVIRRGASNVESLHPAALADDPVDAMLDSLVPALLAAYKVPGAGVAWLEAGDVIWMRGVGEADLASGRPVTPATAFNIGSISKVFAAWTALHLVERGALDLDAPIEGYLTRWSFPPSEFDASGVTARRILRHRAGLSLSGYPGFGPDAQLPTLEESPAGATNGAGDVRLIAEPGSASGSRVCKISKEMRPSTTSTATRSDALPTWSPSATWAAIPVGRVTFSWPRVPETPSSC